MPSFHLNKNSIFILLFIIIGVVCGSIAGAFIAFTHDLPQIRSLENFRPDAVTRIYSSDKVVLAELFIEKREPVSLEAIPRLLKDALVATEDRKFYTHSGVDLKGIARAIINDIEGNRREMTPGSVLYAPAGIAGAHEWEVKEKLQLLR